MEVRTQTPKAVNVSEDLVWTKMELTINPFFIGPFEDLRLQ